jgi:hypothetical protein
MNELWREIVNDCYELLKSAAHCRFVFSVFKPRIGFVLIKELAFMRLYGMLYNCCHQVVRYLNVSTEVRRTSTKWQMKYVYL